MLKLQEEQEIKILRDSLAHSLPENNEGEHFKSHEGSASPHPECCPDIKEVQAIPAEQVLAPSNRDKPVTTSISGVRVWQVRVETAVDIVRNTALVIARLPGMALVSLVPLALTPRP